MFAEMNSEDKIDFIQRFLNNDQTLIVFDSTKVYTNAAKCGRPVSSLTTSEISDRTTEIIELLREQLNYLIPLDEIKNGELEFTDVVEDDLLIVTIKFTPRQVRIEEMNKQIKEREKQKKETVS